MKTISFVLLLALSPCLADQPTEAGKSAQTQSPASRAVAASNTAAKKAALSDLRTQQREAMQTLRAQLESATPEQRREIIEQFREDTAPLRQQQQVLMEDMHQAEGNTKAKQWQRPAIPDNLPAREREELSLRYDLREAQMNLSAQLDNATPEEHRLAIQAYREQTTPKRDQLRAMKEAKRAEREAASPSRTFEPLSIPENLPAEQKARLQARNDRLAAIQQLQQTLENAPPKNAAKPLKPTAHR